MSELESDIPLEMVLRWDVRHLRCWKEEALGPKTVYLAAKWLRKQDKHLHWEQTLREIWRKSVKSWTSESKDRNFSKTNSKERMSRILTI